MSLTTIHNQTSGIKHKEREIGSRKNTIFTQQKYLYIQGKWKMKTDFCVMTGEQESVSKTMANNFYSFRWDLGLVELFHANYGVVMMREWLK